MSVPAQPFVNPVPPNIDKDGHVFHDNLCRFTRKVAGLLNTLSLAGIISPAGPGVWSLSNLIFFGHGAPDPAEAFAGDYYVDLDTANVYLKS